MKHKGKYLLSFFALICLGLIWLHNVPKRISGEDQVSLAAIFDEERIIADDLSFEEQILFIDQMVNTLHQDLMVGVPIAYNTHREPSELIQNGGGLCYDFSRTIEKQLMLNGFKTRHVAAYERHSNFFTTITSAGVHSHSLTEVKTKEGWMIIDSNLPFYAQDANGQIYSFEDLQEQGAPAEWKRALHPELDHFYNGEVVYVYGLYSRHGRFYPPYNFIPDFNLRELFYNL